MTYLLTEEDAKAVREALRQALIGTGDGYLIGMQIQEALAILDKPAAQRGPLIPFRHGCKWCGKEKCAESCPGAAQEVEPYQGPKKFAPEEIADGNRGIRWVTETEVCGRPTDHDVREYLLRTPTAKGCHCEECKAFYRQQPAPAAQKEPDMPKIGCVQHDCDECKARAAQGAKIVVGKYTLSQGRMKGRVWIEHESGEGGDFEVERWYKENF